MTDGLLSSTWSLLLAAREWRRRLDAAPAPFGIRASQDGGSERTDPEDPNAALIWSDGAFSVGPGLAPESSDLVELYLPVLGASDRHPVVVGHLGQSIDAQIATRSGDSCFVTGPGNLTHLHRMRALCDAVIVGAGTVAADNPRLTTRLVNGPNPVRVVIDTDRRLSRTERLFDDGEATTLLVCAADRIPAGVPEEDLIGIRRNGAGLHLETVLATLAELGLHALFIEGGGVTVSRWMTAGLLDRLQIATAPVMIGAGRPGLSLPPVETMRACRRPPYRLFKMGDDILWDFDLRSEPDASDDACRPCSHEAPIRLQ